MKNHHRPGRAPTDGIALMYAVFGTFVAAGLVSVMFTMAGISQRESELIVSTARADDLAEGGIEAAKVALANAVASWQTPPTTGTIDLEGAVVDFTITDAAAERIATDVVGIQTVVHAYEIEARAASERMRATAKRLVEVRATPAFQFAVFYTQDLEINPGPSMTLRGRVHANGDMHLGSGATLRIDTNYLRATGGIYRRRKDNTTSSGTVQVREWVANPFDPAEPNNWFTMQSRSQMNALGIPSVSGYDSSFVDGWDIDGDGYFDGPGEWYPFDAGALEYWGAPSGYGTEGYTVMTGAHDVREARSPRVGSISMFEPDANGAYVLDPLTGEYGFVGAGAGTHTPGYYHSQADLVILVDADGGDFEAFDGAGTSIRQDLIDDGVVTLGTVPDMRQSNGGSTRTGVATVDIAALAASGHFPANGLLYAAHYGTGTGTEAKGLVLTNGEQLAAKMTAVCEGSLYVQGDYNTIDKKGAAVIADAVNLLSNAWTGTKSGSGLPAATQTTFNVAIATGNQETVGSSYNGGLENLPRFHENWSGVPCNITGSFVCAWENLYATGAWVYGGNRYTAPGRNWTYDPDFNTVANLPPFTPMIVTVEDVVSW